MRPTGVNTAKQIIGISTLHGKQHGYLLTPLADTIRPAISVAAPVATTYMLNQRVFADYACVDNPSGSGLAECEGKVADGARVGTFTVGRKQFWVEASDSAGNTRRTTVPYTVSYGIGPLYEENRLRHPSETVKVMFRLCDAHGRNVSDSGITIQTLGLAPGPFPPNTDTTLRYVPQSNGTPGFYALYLRLQGLPNGRHTLSFTAGSDPAVHELSVVVSDGSDD